MRVAGPSALPTAGFVWMLEVNEGTKSAGIG